MKAYNILIVEDEKEICDGVAIYLRNQGYNVFKANNGIEGLEIIEKEDIHLAIVDIMKSEEMDKIMGLNIGADDYVTKPFNPMELIARVNSQLRRYSKYLNIINNLEKKNNNVVVGGLEINVETKEIYVDGENIKVTPIEFKILHLLMKNPGRVFSAEEIYESVWKEQAVNTDTVMVHVRNIREKIEIDSKNPRYLKVVWGVGYKIEKQK